VLALAAALLGLPVTAAQASPDTPALPHRTAVSAPGLSAPTAPSKLKPTAKPRATAGTGMGLANAGNALRMVDPDDPNFVPACTPYITTAVTPVGTGTFQIDYLAEVVCNFYLNGFGQAYLFDRSIDSSNFGVVHVGQSFTFFGSYYGYSYGSVLVDSRLYDGARQIEIGFDLVLQTTDGTLWGDCYEPLPNGQRYLSPCSGLGTTALRVTVGSGILNSGLPPYNPAATIRDTAGYTLINFHVGGQDDPGLTSTARRNIQDAAAGLPARTSPFSDIGSRPVFLDLKMLRGLVHLRLVYGYTMQVTAIAGGDHSDNSPHYFGKAFDVDFVNGVKVTSANTLLPAFKAACRALGATDVRGPGDPGHDTHVHCAWP
jgi:hypothetical protein